MNPTPRIASALAAIAAVAIVVRFAFAEREPPTRCPRGLDPEGARCCGAGQDLVGERCTGPLIACGPGQFRIDAGIASACVLEEEKIELPGGVLPPGAADWQRAPSSEPIEVAPFAIDRGEVTVWRYAECVAKKACKELPGTPEPGLPVTGLPPEEAERFCRFAKGRLPTAAEWRFAASGSEGRRFPWGFTGLVCRRAAFGLEQGPCSHSGTGPDLVGARPDGATPEGVLDLSGNVAEWTRDPDGRYRARGGSYRSRVAAELVTAAVESPDPRATHVGFRCVYPIAKGTAPPAPTK
ncbi:MAG: SUMF1/EgtB/PvdO family nonheme iron enzyme [Pseudomonadota bacterium]|nr:MAG: hypothetical protein DIU78_00915 [Pseudomonadota bacterium]